MRQAVSTAALWAALLLPGAAGAPSPPSMPSKIQIVRGAYRGWADAVRIGNGEVEAVIVPAVGRIMQFRFVGDTDGPFWENPAVDGRRAGKDARGWVNYGGDKVWPAPQSAWAAITGRGWPPPAGFDGRPAQAAVDAESVTLVFPPDPASGLQMRRRITLAPGRPAMAITTSFEKTAGAPVEVGIWTITQMRDPLVVRAPETQGAPILLGGYAAPPMKSAAGWLTVTRDPAADHKIGLRAGTLIWVGPNRELRMDTELVRHATYPDEGSSAEIYTNANPLPYVELELLGPVRTLAPGGRMEMTTTYTLSRRPAAEAVQPPGASR